MSPFEIRLELLKMAKDMLAEDYYTKKELAHNMWEATRDPLNHKPDAPNYPPFPSEKEIIKKAESLYDFICKK